MICKLFTFFSHSVSCNFVCEIWKGVIGGRGGWLLGMGDGYGWGMGVGGGSPWLVALVWGWWRGGRSGMALVVWAWCCVPAWVTGPPALLCHQCVEDDEIYRRVAGIHLPQPVTLRWAERIHSAHLHQSGPPSQLPACRMLVSWTVTLY